MEILFDREGSISSFERHLNEVKNHQDVQSILLLACDDNGFTKEGLDPILQSLGKPCFGGIFPQILYMGEHFSKGTVIVGLEANTETKVIKELSNSDSDLDGVLQDSFAAYKIHASTMFVFVDGLSSGISGLMESLFNQFGLEINYIGGGLALFL